MRHSYLAGFVHNMNTKLLDRIPAICNRYGLTYRQLALRLGISVGLVSEAAKGRGSATIRHLLVPAVNEEVKKLNREIRSAEGAPPCPGCNSAMMRSSKRSHWFHGRLRECWTCHRKCNAGMYGVPMYGVDAGRLIRLGEARNPNTGQVVKIPWRHRVSNYEKRHDNWIWCDQTSGRSDGCGSILAWERTARFKTWKFEYAIFKCRCERYRGHRVYCRAGRVYQKPSITLSSLAKNARICPHCAGRVYRRMGTAYSRMNPQRAARAELVRCRCTNCKKTLYFNLATNSFEKDEDLPIGMRPIQDPHRPRCGKCERKGQIVRRAALHAEPRGKIPSRAPLCVKDWLQRTMQTRPKAGDILAIEYFCPHMTPVWKSPHADGLILNQGGPAPETRANVLDVARKAS
jgi:hypothetical protein